MVGCQEGHQCQATVLFVCRDCGWAVNQGVPRPQVEGSAVVFLLDLYARTSLGPINSLIEFYKWL